MLFLLHFFFMACPHFSVCVLYFIRFIIFLTFPCLLLLLRLTLFLFLFHCPLQTPFSFLFIMLCDHFVWLTLTAPNGHSFYSLLLFSSLALVFLLSSSWLPRLMPLTQRKQHQRFQLTGSRNDKPTSRFTPPPAY